MPGGVQEKPRVITDLSDLSYLQEKLVKAENPEKLTYPTKVNMPDELQHIERIEKIKKELGKTEKEGIPYQHSETSEISSDIQKDFEKNYKSPALQEAEIVRTEKLQEQKLPEKKEERAFSLNQEALVPILKDMGYLIGEQDFVSAGEKAITIRRFEGKDEKGESLYRYEEIRDPGLVAVISHEREKIRQKNPPEYNQEMKRFMGDIQKDLEQERKENIKRHLKEELVLDPERTIRFGAHIKGIEKFEVASIINGKVNFINTENFDMAGFTAQELLDMQTKDFEKNFENRTIKI